MNALLSQLPADSGCPALRAAPPESSPPSSPPAEGIDFASLMQQRRTPADSAATSAPPGQPQVPGEAGEAADPDSQESRYPDELTAGWESRPDSTTPAPAPNGGSRPQNLTPPRLVPGPLAWMMTQGSMASTAELTGPSPEAGEEVEPRSETAQPSVSTPEPLSPAVLCPPPPPLLSSLPPTPPETPVSGTVSEPQTSAAQPGVVAPLPASRPPAGPGADLPKASPAAHQASTNTGGSLPAQPAASAQAPSDAAIPASPPEPGRMLEAPRAAHTSQLANAGTGEVLAALTPGTPPGTSAAGNQGDPAPTGESAPGMAQSEEPAAEAGRWTPHGDAIRGQAASQVESGSTRNRGAEVGAEPRRHTTSLELALASGVATTGAEEGTGDDGEGGQLKEDLGRGTRVAQGSNRMKTTSKEEQSVPWKVKELPVTGMTETATDSLARPNVTRLHLDRHGVLSLEIKAWEWMNSRPAALPLEAGLDEPAAVKQAAILDHVEHLISREVTAIRQLKADSLTVVLKPEAGTEMVLQLQQKEGHVEAFVRCDAAAFDRFQREWPQLQESLASLNVRLLPLKENPSANYQEQAPRQAFGSMADSNPSPQHHRQEQAPPQETEPLLPEPVMAEAPRPRSARASRTSLEGWETWA